MINKIAKLENYLKKLGFEEEAKSLNLVSNEQEVSIETSEDMMYSLLSWYMEYYINSLDGLKVLCDTIREYFSEYLTDTQSEEMLQAAADDDLDELEEEDDEGLSERGADLFTDGGRFTVGERYDQLAEATWEASKEELTYPAELKEVMSDVSAKEGKEFLSHADWYLANRRAISEILGLDEEDESFKLFLKMLSVTSPMSSPKANFSLAIKAIEQMLRFEEPSGFINPKNVIATQFGGKISGFKVTNFYKNLTGNKSVVTMDRHMFEMIFRMYQYPKGKLVETLTNDGQVIVSEVGRMLDLSPSEAQAAMWAYNQLYLTTKRRKQPGTYLDEIVAKRDEVSKLLESLRNWKFEDTGFPVDAWKDNLVSDSLVELGNLLNEMGLKKEAEAVKTVYRLKTS